MHREHSQIHSQNRKSKYVINKCLEVWSFTKGSEISNAKKYQSFQGPLRTIHRVVFTYLKIPSRPPLSKMRQGFLLQSSQQNTICPQYIRATPGSTCIKFLSFFFCRFFIGRFSAQAVAFSNIRPISPADTSDELTVPTGRWG